MLLNAIVFYIRFTARLKCSAIQPSSCLSQERTIESALLLHILIVIFFALAVFYGEECFQILLNRGFIFLFFYHHRTV